MKLGLAIWALSSFSRDFEFLRSLGPGLTFHMPMMEAILDYLGPIDSKISRGLGWGT